LLRPLPAEGIDPGLTLTPRVDRYARVMVRMAHYSVPARLIGRRVKVSLRAQELVVFDGRVEVARHARSVRKGWQSLLLDHYLEVLARKPGALPGATALAQARGAGAFTPAHDAFWASARKSHGDAGGTRAMVEVLLLHRHLAHGDVVAGLAAAVAVGSTSADVVAVEARKAAQLRGASPTVGAPARLACRRQAAAVGRPVRQAAGPPARSRDPRSLMTTTSSASAVRTGRGGVTEQAADAAVDQACRMLRLPTMRGPVRRGCRRRATRTADLPRGSWPSC